MVTYSKELSESIQPYTFLSLHVFFSIWRMNWFSYAMTIAVRFCPAPLPPLPPLRLWGLFGKVPVPISLENKGRVNDIRHFTANIATKERNCIILGRIQDIRWATNLVHFSACRCNHLLWPATTCKKHATICMHTPWSIDWHLSLSPPRFSMCLLPFSTCFEPSSHKA